MSNTRRFPYLPALAAVLSIFFLGACQSPEDRAAGYLASAEAHFAEGDLVKAEIEVKNALQIWPKNPKGRFLLANINESRREFQDMASNLRIAVEADPDFVEARIKLGVLYALAGERELAEEQAKLVKGADRDRVDARLLFARVAAAGGDLETARVELEAAVRKEPTNEQALGLLASVAATTDLPAALALIDKGIAQADDKRALRLLRIQILQRDPNRGAEVEKEYRALMTDYPGDVEFGYQYAQFLASAGRIDDVEPVLQQIVINDPDNIQARLALVQFVARSKGAAAAEKLLSEYVAALPDKYEFRMALAGIYQQSGRSDEAFREYKAVADAAGNEDEGLKARSSMAALKLAGGNEDEGEALLAEVLAVDSVNAQALILRAALSLQRSDFKKAVSDLREVLRTDPSNLQAQLLLARVHNQAGDVVLAEDAYRRALTMSPGNEVATLELARILVSRSKFDDARDLLQKQLDKAPGDIRFIRALISVLLAQNLPKEALAEAERVAAIPGQEAVGNFLLGGVYQATGDQEKAVAAFQQSLKTSPTAPESLRGMVASMIQLGRAEQARSYLAALAEEYPDNLYVKTLLGQVLASSGNSGEGLKVIESALQADAEWLPGYTTLAGLQSGDIVAQISTYKRGLEAMPGSQELVLLLGTAYEKNGQIEEAIAAYEAALRTKPDSPAVANNLASLLADYRTDKDSLRRALALADQFRNSSNPAFLDTLGWIHYRLGEFKEATPLLKKAVEGAPQIPVLQYHLGMAYLAENKKSMAKEHLEIALKDENVSFTGIDDARKALAGI
jgi:Flp pilus assembly protein TadD